MTKPVALAIVTMATLLAAACGDGGTAPEPPRPNRPPAAQGSIPAQTVPVGETVAVGVASAFSDPDGDALTYSAASSAPGVASVTVAGADVTITGVSAGTAYVTVTASDPGGLAAQQAFEVTVPNRAPVPTDSIPDKTVQAGDSASVNLAEHISDPDGDALAFEAESSAPDIATAAVSGASMTITGVSGGTATITVTASDPDGLAAQQAFEVTVPNRAPVVGDSIPGQTVQAGDAVSLDLAGHFSDPDGDALSYAAESSTADVAIVAVSGASVTVTRVSAGSATVTVTASDPGGLEAEQNFKITVPNRPPEPLGTIPAQSIATGETVTLDASTYFTDPDGDSLSFAAASSNTRAVETTVSGSDVTVVGAAAGAATVTVTASDPGGLSAVVTFEVSVSAPPDGFHIELVFASSVTATQEAAFRHAASRWMTVLAPTELPDFEAQNWSCGDDPRFERHAAIDDVMIVAVVEEVDGPGKTLGSAGPCWVRRASQLPIYGRMRIDAADLERVERRGGLKDLVLHEMGHVLGIGTIWEVFELLGNPSSEVETLDTHFTGPLAIEAFDDAGGRSYDGAKVPVENTGGEGTWNSHWRETVMQAELMTGWSEGGDREPLSVFTIQSLADLGYAVDATAADPYRLPDPDAARTLEPIRRIPYGNDIWRGPIVVADPDGRIVRVIPGAGGDGRDPD